MLGPYSIMMGLWWMSSHRPVPPPWPNAPNPPGVQASRHSCGLAVVAQPLRKGRGWRDQYNFKMIKKDIHYNGQIWSLMWDKLWKMFIPFSLTNTTVCPRKSVIASPFDNERMPAVDWCSDPMTLEYVFGNQWRLAPNPEICNWSIQHMWDELTTTRLQMMILWDHSWVNGPVIIHDVHLESITVESTINHPPTTWFGYLFWAGFCWVNGWWWSEW